MAQVTNMTEYNDYISSLNAWETERQRQRVEFTITEDDMDADLRIPSAQVVLHCPWSQPPCFQWGLSVLESVLHIPVWYHSGWCASGQWLQSSRKRWFGKICGNSHSAVYWSCDKQCKILFNNAPLYGKVKMYVALFVAFAFRIGPLVASWRPWKPDCPPLRQNLPSIRCTWGQLSVLLWNHLIHNIKLVLTSTSFRLKFISSLDSAANKTNISGCWTSSCQRERQIWSEVLGKAWSSESLSSASGCHCKNSWHHWISNEFPWPLQKCLHW